MKKLHKLIITAYIGPFFVTFFIVLFIFVMQFLWKYIDDMVGKGLEWYLLAELLFYATANLVPMSLPLAILLASLMTFGSMGEHYELVALKSAGLSLQRIMYPLTVFIMFTSLGAFYFSNSIWPLANLKFASLLYDIRHKKPAFDIAEGIFYNGIENYTIRIGKKEKDGKTLQDVTIYDHHESNGNTRVTRAKSGRMEVSPDKQYLIFTLYNGNSYDEELKRTRPMMRSSFEEEVIRFNLSGFEMKETDDKLFKSHYQMQTIGQLEYAIDSLNEKLHKRKDEFANVLFAKSLYLRDTLRTRGPDTAGVATDSLNLDTVMAGLNRDEQRAVLEAASNLTRVNKNYLVAIKNDLHHQGNRINRYRIEWHRKFTLSIACLIMFFIGAPLGAIIRKGGLGMPV
ncbi:MAG: LptF/LptG family permease, partial [Bacteroidota bacterium]